MSAGLLTGLLGGIALLLYSDSKVTEPEVHTTLTSGLYNDSGLKYLLNDFNKPSLELLSPHFTEIREQIERVNKHEAISHSWGNPVLVNVRIHNMSLRMCYSLERSVLMESEESKRNEYGTDRYLVSLLPKNFAEKIVKSRKYLKSDEDMELHRKVGFSVWYLKHCLGTNDSLADVYATYFCDPEEIFEARQKAGTTEYFPKMKDRNLVQGYSAHLSETKRNLISRAVVLYAITDNEGKVHLDEIPSLNKMPINGLADK